MRRELVGVLGALGAITALTAQAVPTLQLNITGGTYYSPSETVITSNNPFTVNAYLLPDAKNATGDTYAISVALVPQTSPPG